MSRIAICCTVCGKQSFVTDPYREDDAAVNRHSVLAMQTISRGRASLETFTSIMSMLPPASKPTFSFHNDTIALATSEEREAQFAAILWKDAAPDEVVHVRVTCDDTWARRGHTCLHSVIVVATWKTGLILILRCSANSATSAKVEGIRTLVQMSLWTGGKVIRLHVPWRDGKGKSTTHLDEIRGQVQTEVH